MNVHITVETDIYPWNLWHCFCLHWLQHIKAPCGLILTNYSSSLFCIVLVYQAVVLLLW